MPWVAGVFTRANPDYSGDDVWQQDAANGNEVISSSRHDSHDQDLSEGINNCLAKDGSNAMTNDLNMGGNKIINAGVGSVAGDVALLGQTITDITYSLGTITFVRESMADLTLTLSELGLEVGVDIQAYNAGLAAIASLAKTDGNIIVGNGTTWVAESGATARASLGLAIGTNVQAYDADLTAIGALAKTNGNFIVGNGSTWVAESGATARASLGLSGATTVSSSAPSGGSNGDVWFQV